MVELDWDPAHMPSSHFIPFTRLPFPFLSQHPAPRNVPQVNRRVYICSFLIYMSRADPSYPFCKSTLSCDLQADSENRRSSASSLTRTSASLNSLGSGLSFPSRVDTSEQDSATTGGDQQLGGWGGLLPEV